MTDQRKQVVLSDKSSSGKERPYPEKKMKNELLAIAYDDINPDKAQRLRECATRLSFQEKDDGSLKLVGMWNCRLRLCPVCSWRRGLKIQAQMFKTIPAMLADHNLAFALLTLTLRNCEPEDLSSTLDLINVAFIRMMQRVRVKNAVEGWYRAIEVTHKREDNTFHPHIHVLLAVKPGYFSGGRYINQAEWVQLWREALRVNYDPGADIRRVKGDLKKGVLEVTKYSVKETEYIIPDDWDLTVELVRILDSALHKRRFVALGGLMKEYHKKLNLEDPEDGDLINVTGEQLDLSAGRIIHFLWYSGFRQYYKEPD